MWVLSRVKIVACKMQKHKDVWNAVRASKCVRENDFQVHSEHFDMSHCQDMRCVDKIWDIPVRPSLDEDLRLASACVSNFGVSLGLGHGACAVAVSFVKDRLPCSGGQLPPMKSILRTCVVAYGLRLCPTTSEKSSCGRSPRTCANGCSLRYCFVYVAARRFLCQRG